MLGRVLCGLVCLALFGGFDVLYDFVYFNIFGCLVFGVFDGLVV